MLKGQHIGDSLAALYVEWATLEHNTGVIQQATFIMLV